MQTTMIALLIAVLASIVLAVPLHARPQAASMTISAYQPRPFGGELRIMTYNVHGLPWPIARGRAAQLAAIGQRLRALHATGRAPEIVLVQEAFTAEARALGLQAGYRYVAFGPDANDHVEAPAPPDGSWRELLIGERRSKGEALGKFVGSGLAIFSDYPLSNIREMTFTSPVCAGFDCLASKGAMIAQVTLPGSLKVEVATTHMNSRSAAAVTAQRADLAWREQGQELVSFIRQRRNPVFPLLIGGDFNVGRALPRQEGMATLISGLANDTSDALHSLADSGLRLSADARHELVHAKDWELSLSGKDATLVALDVEVPFGRNHGTPLSDHYGYAIRYALSHTARGNKPGNQAPPASAFACRFPDSPPCASGGTRAALHPSGPVTRAPPFTPTQLSRGIATCCGD